MGYLLSDLDFCEPRTLAHHLGEYLRMMGVLVCGFDPVKFASSNELGNGKQLTTAVLPESRLAAAGIACMQLRAKSVVGWEKRPSLSPPRR